MTPEPSELRTDSLEHLRPYISEREGSIRSRMHDEILAKPRTPYLWADEVHATAPVNDTFQLDVHELLEFTSKTENTLRRVLKEAASKDEYIPPLIMAFLIDLSNGLDRIDTLYDYIWRGSETLTDGRVEARGKLGAVIEEIRAEAKSND